MPGVAMRIPLRDRAGVVVGHAVIDDVDAPLVADERWHCSSTGYAVRSVRVAGRSAKVYLHRVLLGLAERDPREGDHENGDRLDNRRQNLRIASGTQNRRNVGARRKGPKGVWCEAGRWRARIYVDGVALNLGSHDTAVEAAAAYDRAAREAFGEFARLNQLHAVAQ